LVKDVMAFANTEGGYIVIGVAEVDKGFLSTASTATAPENQRVSCWTIEELHLRIWPIYSPLPMTRIWNE
jgi:predicted HTH transcriptional regulator